MSKAVNHKSKPHVAKACFFCGGTRIATAEGKSFLSATPGGGPGNTFQEERYTSAFREQF